jgi:hypothetical protein
VPERLGTILISAVVAHTAWHWMVERGASLGDYAWSLQDTILLADVLRWTMRIVAVAGLIWLVRRSVADKADKADKANPHGQAINQEGK